MGKIGLYYYPWYNSKTWAEAQVLNTPEYGWYDSSNILLIDKHIEIFQYLNIDYLILEYVVPSDWKYDFITSCLYKITEKLKQNGIKFTYLIDPITRRNWYKINFNKIIEDICQINSPTFFIDGKQLYLNFSPPLDIAYQINEKYGDKYSIFNTCYNECFQNTIKYYIDYCNTNARKILNPIIWGESVGITISPDEITADVFEKFRYFKFWESTDKLKCMNGFCPVIPGYDDLLLCRNPQLAPIVPRENGRTFIEQFKRAQELNSEHILIYSFNEYFETTNIEPTLEYGNFYLDITKHCVECIHNGEHISFPKDAVPEKGNIIYLNREIALGAQRHADKIPRWCDDYYVAEINVSSTPYVENNHICLDKIIVTNTGIKGWPIASKNATISLGCRLVDINGKIISEGRTSLGNEDIAPQKNISTSIKVEIIGKAYPHNLLVGVVWENKFWLQEEKNILLPKLMEKVHD